MNEVDEFLRRFAASPIHVPPLERVLAVYGQPSQDAFAATVIGWDRAAAHPEAARIALELLVAHVDADGVLMRLSDDAVGRAILSVPAGSGDLRQHLRRSLGLAPHPVGDGA